MTQPHRQYRQEDEFYCTRCGKRWSVTETAPSCAPLGKGKPIYTPAPQVPGSKYL